MILDKDNLIKKLPEVEDGQLLIVGSKILSEQATEIIRRTDIFVKKSFKSSWSSKFKGLPKHGVSIPQSWRYLDLVYFGNDFICPIHYTGYQGWCHPSGEIYYDFNSETLIYPAKIFKEAEIVAKEFEYLKFICIVFNRGFGEFTEQGIAPQPIYGLYVNDGKVMACTVQQAFEKMEEFVEDVPETIVRSWLKDGKENRYNESIPLETVKTWY